MAYVVKGKDESSFSGVIFSIGQLDAFSKWGSFIELDIFIELKWGSVRNLVCKLIKGWGLWGENPWNEVPVRTSQVLGE